MATTAFGSLAAPVAEEMEMSSPANRNLDDDIDIDFDDYQPGAQMTDDERMLEDGDHTRPTTATDDMMDDDTLPGEQPLVQEEIMKDDVPQVQEVQQVVDEELIDYGDEDFQEEPVDNTTIPVAAQPTELEDPGLVFADDAVPAAAESVSVEEPTAVLQEEGIAEVPQTEESAPALEEFLSAELAHEDGANLEEGHVFADELEPQENTEHVVADDHSHQAVHEDDGLQFPPPINTSVSTSTDTPRTPTDTGLHPMTVRFGDLLLPLFKSLRQPDGLLKDDNLANLSLAELITNCRSRLALKIGEDISDDQELVLGFDNMGLLLVEDCRAAFQSSLHDVLEVYLQLHQNDGSEEIPPLSINLTLQLKFQSSFAILKQAAAGGQGMSSFNFLQPTSAHEEFYREEYEDAGLAPSGEHDEFEGQDYADPSYENNGKQVAHNVGESQEQYEDTGAEGHEEFYQEGEYHEHLGEEEFYVPEQDEASARLDELEADNAYHQDQVNELEDPGAGVDELNAEEHQAASTASSTTVQGDSANNTAGEYDDEDLIDWDSESLTPLSEHSSDPQDFSTFLTEFEEEQSKESLPQDDAPAPVDGVAAPDQSAELHLGSEDFLNDRDGQEHGDETYEGEYEGGEEAEHGEEYTFDQADTYDEQREEFHPDYQPGEEDEQFHTAQDFLNFDEYEHGPEHDVAEEDEEGLDDTVGTVIHHETAEYDEQEDYGDEIGFDQEDDAEEQHIAPATIPGKRSFDDLEDELEVDDREIKKVRAS